MHNHIPDWLYNVLIQERIGVTRDSFLEDNAVNKSNPKDFELEWQEHVSKNISKTWGFDPNQRFEQFLIETETTKSDLRNLLVMDAGCGNGLLTEAIAEQGAKILGVDLINNLKQLTKKRKRLDNLFYLLADINNLPLKEGSFDLIVSNGVLHHTPNTKESFLQLAKHVKPGGKLYIWLYRRPFTLRNKVFLFISDLFRKIISRLPRTIQKSTVKSFTRLFYTLSRLRNGRNSTKSYNDLLIDIYDSYTPRYRHYHHPIEVAGWFHEAFFSSPILTHWDNSFGFGMYAVKKLVKTTPAGENFGTISYNDIIHLS